MKKTILVTALTVALCASSNAFVVATANLITPDATGGSPVFDASGNVINVGSGSISVGYFSTLLDANLAATDFATLKADFVQLGNAAPFSNAFTAPGFFDVSVGAPVADGSAFVDELVYVFIGNGADIASSTDIAVWRGSITFQPTADQPGGNVVLTQSGFESLLVGSDGGTQSVLGIDFDKSISLANAPIPEPSVALLGAFGILGLLRRRR